MLTAAYFCCLRDDSFGASIFGFPLVDTAYGVMVLSAISSSSVLYNIRSKIIVSIATYSYTIYLTHKLIINAVQNGFEKAGVLKESNFVFIICAIACLLCGYLMNKLIEQPSLNVRKKMLSKE